MIETDELVQRLLAVKDTAVCLAKENEQVIDEAAAWMEKAAKRLARQARIIQAYQYEAEQEIEKGHEWQNEAWFMSQELSNSKSRERRLYDVVCGWQKTSVAAREILQIAELKIRNVCKLLDPDSDEEDEA